MPEGTILIADDDSAIRTVLNQALGRAGYDVRTTGTAAGLWRWVSAGDGNMVITDVVLPDESGFDLIPRIKRIRPDMPIVVMSAQNTILTAITATERGAFDYLPKPFDLKELTAIVQRALASPQKKREPLPAETSEDRLPLIGRSPGDAGNLPRYRAADADRSHRDDHGRERYGQGACGTCITRLRQEALWGLRRGQYGGHPKRIGGKRTVRSRARCVHGRHQPRYRPFRTGGRRYAVPRRDRRHAARRANASAAGFAAGRIHDCRRPHRAQDRCAHHRRDQSRSASTDPARACSAKISTIA